MADEALRVKQLRTGGRPYVKQPESNGAPKTKKAGGGAGGAQKPSGNQPKKVQGGGGNNQANGGAKKAANGNAKNETNGLKKSKEGAAQQIAKVEEAKKEQQEEEEELTCLICCEPIDFFSVGDCEHRFVCSQCTLRRRGLYKELHCCICKVRASSFRNENVILPYLLSAAARAG